MQLVPDIEFRLYESTKSKVRETNELEEKITIEKNNIDIINQEEVDVTDDCDIVSRLSRIVGKNGYVCFPSHEQNVSNKT